MLKWRVKVKADIEDKPARNELKKNGDAEDGDSGEKKTKVDDDGEDNIDAEIEEAVLSEKRMDKR